MRVEITIEFSYLHFHYLIKFKIYFILRLNICILWNIDKVGIILVPNLKRKKEKKSTLVDIISMNIKLRRCLSNFNYPEQPTNISLTSKRWKSKCGQEIGFGIFWIWLRSLLKILNHKWFLIVLRFLPLFDY